MSSAPRLLTKDDVLQAARRVGHHLPPTPLRPSFALAPRTGYLKLECWQPTGSFKVRGALNALASLSRDDLQRGIVAASAGNHALGVAFAATKIGGGIQARLYVPSSAPRTKLRKLRTFGVDVREGGATYDDAYGAAMEDVQRSGATYVHAYDDPATAAGQGGIGVEILEQLPSVATIVVPCGGGGLVAGIAAYAKAVRPSVRVVAVQPEASPSLRRSLERGQALHEYPFEPTIADGIAGGIGDLVFAHRTLIDDVVEVPEAEIEKAMMSLLSEDQVVAEASGAVGLAAVASGRVPCSEEYPVAVVVTGGNVDGAVLAQLFRARH